MGRSGTSPRILASLWAAPREATRDLIFKALGDARRRRILDLLKTAPRTTGEICDFFLQLDHCTVMQHLNVLEEAELVIVRRHGRYRWNYLNPLPIKDIHDRWFSRYAAGAVDLLARLKQDLEEEDPRPRSSLGIAHIPWQARRLDRPESCREPA